MANRVIIVGSDITIPTSLSAAQIADLRSILTIAEGQIKLFAYGTTAWRTLLTESDAQKNLRVKLYDGAGGIASHQGSSVTILDASRALDVNSFLRLSDSENNRWIEWRTAQNSPDGQAGTIFPAIALMGFNGATFDRLRTWGTGVLKVGRAEIDSTTVRHTGTGAVVAGAHKLYWVACSPDAPNAEFELTDAIAAGGAVVYDHFDTDKHSEHLHFDPPMKFATGIYIETFTNMKSLVFCYV